MDQQSRPDLAPHLANLTVAIVGHGSQGSAWAANLADTGVRVLVALRPGSPQEAKARAAGHTVVSLEFARKQADVFCMLTPDETHPGLLSGPLAALPAGAA